MKTYLQDIVNRLSQFSEKLDNTTFKIDERLTSRIWMQVKPFICFINLTWYWGLE